MTTTPTPDPAEHVADISGNDFYDSLTGEEEKNITAAYQRTAETLYTTDPHTFARAMVYAHRMRQGDKGSEAFKYASGLTKREVRLYFPKDPPEPIPDQPVTEPGKDD